MEAFSQIAWPVSAHVKKPANTGFPASACKTDLGKLARGTNTDKANPAATAQVRNSSKRLDQNWV